MIHEDAYFEANGERLVGTIDYCNDKSQPTVLILHGAGTSTRARSKYISEALANYGKSSFRFDFSGHGESTGTLSTSTLNKRLNEAEAAVSIFLPDPRSTPITVIASSMGAHIGARLCEKTPIASMILFCPAAYAREAENVAFDEHFTQILRTPNSFANSMSFAAMSNFVGDFAIIIGSADKTIPPAVVEQYEAAAVNARSRTTIELKEAPHLIHGWLDSNRDVRELVLRFVCSLAA